MKTIASFFSEYTAWVQFHIIMLAAFVTGFLMAYSAQDLGPMAPLMISCGICVMIFSIVAEALLLIRRTVAKAARNYLKKSVGFSE